MLHSDPSILGKCRVGLGSSASPAQVSADLGELTLTSPLASGYSLHGPSGEIESVDDY